MPDAALLDEVREIRHRIAEECENNIAKIAERAAEAAMRFKNTVRNKDLISNPAELNNERENSITQ